MRVKVGDLFMIVTPKGFGYFQCVERDPKYGHLIRILPGVFLRRPDDLEEFARQKERFFIFFPLGAAAHRGIVERVANYPVPEGSSRPRRMKLKFTIGPGFPTRWKILEAGRKDRLADTLTEDERGLSNLAIVNDTMLAEMIAQGWTPSSEFEKDRK
jgi:hypothetical protein